MELCHSALFRKIDLMSKRVEIISKTEVFKKAIFRIEEAQLRHELYNGTMSEKLTRLNLERGDSVAAIMHDRDADTVILTEQFRYCAYDKGPGWMLEIPAGSVEKDEDPADTMRREIKEEIGYEVERIKHLCTFYVSPGGTSERILLYYASVTPKQQTSQGGGLVEEGEDIRILTMKVNQALRKIDTGEIVDAKTIIGLQWLQLHRSI
jgi:ADP-ribose pyrophosphatase